MSLKIMVLAKQVPDTRNVGPDAMKADGTVNRSALEAIFNPDDLCALEQALLLKERLADVEVHVLTMGPPRAADLIRDALYRGADRGYLITDRRFAGADTLATSYVLSRALEYLKPWDLVLCGRQAIDGDTAQVGPQTAENLGLPQVTYAEEILSLEGGRADIRRRLERGTEIVQTGLPAVVTVHGSAQPCRPRNAHRLLTWKYARTATELQAGDDDYLATFEKRPHLRIEELGMDDLGGDLERVGLSGSPTKVKNIENVVITAKESLRLGAADEEIRALMGRLIQQHILG